MAAGSHKQLQVEDLGKDVSMKRQEREPLTQMVGCVNEASGGRTFGEDGLDVLMKRREGEPLV
ncbi:hypothetical protein ACLOJK_027791 [Asimina triloba]